MIRSRQHIRICVRVAVLALVVGCASEESKRDAINAINAQFKSEYEAELARNGTHVVNANPNDAFDSVYASLLKLGFVVTQQSRSLGLIAARAPAPSPLSQEEWDRAAATDLPKAKELLRGYNGSLADFFQFERRGLDIGMTSTILGTRRGAEISFTMRMREAAPTQSSLPRRDYPPPTAFEAGLKKVWATVDKELAARRKP